MATASQTIAIYNAVLQRDPTDAEVATFVANSQTAEGENSQVDLLVNSSEANSFVAPIVRLYQATFGRVPDAAGLDFWSDYLREQSDAGETTFDVLTTINAGFAASSEFAARFPEAAADGIVDETFLTALYQQTFGRDPSDADIEFYVGAQISQTLSAFAQSSETISMFDPYVDLFLTKSAAGTQDFEGSLLDSNDDGVVDGNDDLSDQPIPGDSLSLTTTIGETVLGTNANDTISAIIGGATPAEDDTLQTGDTVDGAAGTDTLEIFMTGNANGLPAGASIRNVEIINLYQDDGSFDATIDAEDFGAAAQQIWQIGSDSTATIDVDIENVAEGQTVGYRMTTIASEATFDGASGMVALDMVGDGSALSVAGTDVTSLTVSGTVDDDGASPAGPGALALTDNSTSGAGGAIGIESLTGSFSSDVLLDISSFTAATSVDLSGTTGDIGNATTTTDLSALVALETFVSGSGSDTLTYSSATAEATALTMDLGAGSDVLNLAAANNTEDTTIDITLGAGNDTVAVTALANATDETNFEADLVTITDFSAADDVLDLSVLALTQQTLTNTQLAAVAAEASLEDAVDTAAGFDATNGYVAFDYAGDAYVVVTGGDGAFDDGDGIIKLAGVSVNDFDASNFVA